MTERERIQAQLDECERQIEKYAAKGDVSGVHFFESQKRALLEIIELELGKRKKRKRVELDRLRSLSLAAKEALTR